jgi:hypothetical protein
LAVQIDDLLYGHSVNLNARKLVLGVIGDSKLILWDMLRPQRNNRQAC